MFKALSQLFCIALAGQSYFCNNIVFLSTNKFMNVLMKSKTLQFLARAVNLAG